MPHQPTETALLGAVLLQRWPSWLAIKKVGAYFLFFFSILASFFSLAVFAGAFFFSFLASLDFMACRFVEFTVGRAAACGWV